MEHELFMNKNVYNYTQVTELYIKVKNYKVAWRENNLDEFPLCARIVRMK